MLMFYLSMLEEPADKELFTAIYEANHEKMYSIALSILSKPELASEAVHETFLDIIEGFQKFSALSDKHRQGWIALATKYIAINIGKKEKRSVAVSDDYLFYMADKERDEQQEVLYEELADAINELPKHYRDVLELYYVYGYSNWEIGEMLDISVDNVMQRCSRSRKMLLEKMNDR